MATVRKSLEDPKYAWKYVEKKMPGVLEGTSPLHSETPFESDWDETKIKIKEIAHLKNLAKVFDLKISELSTDDPMPWNPRDHDIEFNRVMEEVRLGMRDYFKRRRLDRAIDEAVKNKVTADQIS